MLKLRLYTGCLATCGRDYYLYGFSLSVILRTVAQESYSGSGSAVLSSGSTSSIYGMVAPDTVIPQQQVIMHTPAYTCTVTSRRRHQDNAGKHAQVNSRIIWHDWSNVNLQGSETSTTNPTHDKQIVLTRNEPHRFRYSSVLEYVT